MDAHGQEMDTGNPPDLVVKAATALVRSITTVMDLIGPAPVLAGNGEDPGGRFLDKPTEAGVERHGPILPGGLQVHPGYT